MRTDRAACWELCSKQARMHAAGRCNAAGDLGSAQLLVGHRLEGPPQAGASKALSGKVQHQQSAHHMARTGCQPRDPQPLFARPRAMDQAAHDGSMHTCWHPGSGCMLSMGTSPCPAPVHAHRHARAQHSYLALLFPNMHEPLQSSHNKEGWGAWASILSSHRDGSGSMT